MARTAKSASSQSPSERSAARERALLEAARALMLDQGFERTRMADVAERAGVSEGTVFLYFKSKQQLFDRLLQDFYHRLSIGAREAVVPHASTHDRLAAFIEHTLVSCLESYNLVRYMRVQQFGDPDYRGSALYQLNKGYVDILDGVLTDGVARGDVRDDVPRWALRDLFFGGIDHVMNRLRRHDRRPEIDDACTAFLTLYESMAAPSAHAEPGGPSVEDLAELEAASERTTELVRSLRSRA